MKASISRESGNSNEIILNENQATECDQSEVNQKLDLGDQAEAVSAHDKAEIASTEKSDEKEVETVSIGKLNDLIRSFSQ